MTRYHPPSITDNICEIKQEPDEEMLTEAILSISQEVKQQICKEEFYIDQFLKVEILIEPEELQGNSSAESSVVTSAGTHKEYQSVPSADREIRVLTSGVRRTYQKKHKGAAFIGMSQSRTQDEGRESAIKIENGVMDHKAIESGTVVNARKLEADCDKHTVSIIATVSEDNKEKQRHSDAALFNYYDDMCDNKITSFCNESLTYLSRPRQDKENVGLHYQQKLSCDTTLPIQHLTTHTGEKTRSCSQGHCTTNNHSKLPSRKFMRKKSYSCANCEYTSVWKEALIQHLKIHTGEKPYSCPYCNYTCRQKANLKQHLKRHTGEKPYSCSYCEHNFSQKGNLMRHLRKHTGEKPYSCSHCEYSCSQKVHLITHLSKHTGEKPYSCLYCDYSCSTNSNLKRHLKNTHR